MSLPEEVSSQDPIIGVPCLSSAPRIPDTTGCHQGWSAIGRWTRRRLKSFLLMLDSDSACSQACPLGPDGQPGAWVWRGFLEAEDGDSFVSFGVQGPASCPRRSWETKGSRCHAAGGCPSTLPASPLSPACGCSWLPGALDEGDPSLCPSAPTPPTPGDGSVGCSLCSPSSSFTHFLPKFLVTRQAP